MEKKTIKCVRSAACLTVGKEYYLEYIIYAGEETQVCVFNDLNESEWYFFDAFNLDKYGNYVNTKI